MKLSISGVLVTACAFAFLAPPALAIDVTVRVEGANQTLQATTAVSLPGPAVDKSAEGGTTCSTTSGGSALEAAVGGDWGGRSDSFGQRVERIRGEVHRFEDGRYWSLYVNDTAASVGLCGFTPQQGDELLLYAACAGATSGCYTGEPLDLKAPSVVRPGEAFSVQVQEIVTTYGPAPDYEPTTTKSASSGATVAGGGASATTAGDGHATLTLNQRGLVMLVATKGSAVREGVTVCVTDGADGACGSSAPGQPGAAAGTGSSGAAFVPDRIRPVARLSSPRSRTYSRKRPPRLLKGRVEDTGGVLMVKLRLTRTTPGGRCFAFSGKRERFIRRPKCGASSGWWFRIGDRAAWEYQLPRKLGPGRYVLDVNAIDRSYNRDDERRRDVNRVVFTVR